MSRSLIALALLAALLVAVANAACSTKPLKSVTTDSSQGTFIYSWTTHTELMPNPVPVIKSNCLHSIFDAQNQQSFCQTYQMYLNATKPADKATYSNQLSNTLNTGIMGGHGFYFAADPFISGSWGSLLLVVQVPPKKSIPFYLGKDPALVVQTILTSADDMLYSWSSTDTHKWVLVLRDYHGITYPDGSIKATIIDMTVSPVEFFNHKVPAGSWSPDTYLYAFRDIFRSGPPSVKVLSGGHDISDSDLASVIGWEWRQGCNATVIALTKLNDPSITGSSVYYAIQSASFSGSWSQLIKVLVSATYLPSSANIAQSDFKSLTAALVKAYRARGGDKVVLAYYIGMDKLKSQSPNINSWFR